MSNGRLAYPVWTRETLCQDLIHNRRILGGSSSQWSFAPHEQIAVRRAVTGAAYCVCPAAPYPPFLISAQGCLTP